MNRDERLSRVAGLPPRSMFICGRRILCPSEPAGGTWIALNADGVCYSLINWYSVAARVNTNPTSRGVVVPAISSLNASASVTTALEDLPLSRINPFRLIGIFPAGYEVAEWRWDLKRLTRDDHQWNARQWISSGFDELKAQRERGRAFRQAQGQQSVWKLEWLRRLHQSHSPDKGPFSTCMHRSDAATVSYTEVRVSARSATMHYHSGALCQHSKRYTRRLQFQ